MLYLNCRCYFCQQRLSIPSHGICSFCLTYLPPLPLCCPQCGLPAGSEQEICGRCQLEPPPWQHLIAVGDYQNPLKQILIKLKFQRQTQFKLMLSRLFLLRWLEQRRNRLLPKPDILISVPLHKRRRWQRGFNQTELLAEPLSQWVNCFWSPSLLSRNRSTRPQQQLSAFARRNNLFDAFLLNGSVNGLNVAVLDDVITTGSTLAEISRLLIRNGAKTVQAWCICRTLLVE